jgi:CRP-like cAMP-binding protein
MGRNAHVRIPAEPPRADLLALEKDLVGPSRARDILSSIGWLSRQPESFQDEVFRRLVPVRYAAGDIIYRQGDPLGGIYGVVSGTVIASVAPGKSVPHILHMLTPRGWTGEGSFLSREPRRIELRAARGILSNASRKTVNAALGRFEKSGWVKRGYRSITITNMKRLTLFAESGRD